MYRVIFFWLLMATAANASIIDSPVFINELHYDNVGADTGEFVEVVASAARSDVSALTVTLYNGGHGTAYGSPFSLDSFLVGDTTNGKTLYSLAVSMQNGAPDGLALADGNQVLQFLSYEGSFAATNGVAAGLTSTDIGVAETTSTPSGLSLQLSGTGDSYADFAWQAPARHTRGSANHDQFFDSSGGGGGSGGGGSVPEPASLLIWAGLAAATRRARQRAGRR